MTRRELAAVVVLTLAAGGALALLILITIRPTSDFLPSLILAIINGAVIGLALTLLVQLILRRS